MVGYQDLRFCHLVLLRHLSHSDGGHGAEHILAETTPAIIDVCYTCEVDTTVVVAKAINLFGSPVISTQPRRTTTTAANAAFKISTRRDFYFKTREKRLRLRMISSLTTMAPDYGIVELGMGDGQWK